MDLYETPAVAVEALLRVERIPHRLWELAAGRGAIVRVLRAHGHAVIASDLIDYGFPLHSVSDFLTATAMPAGCEAILTNPPFQWAEEFVGHALELSPLTFLLLRLAFMESERRSHILEGRGLAHVYVFRKRLPMMHRDGWEGRKANSGMAFAWFKFDRAHTGPAIISRISWERPEKDQPSVGGLRRHHEEEAIMAEKPKLQAVTAVPPPDPFDIASLRLNPSFLETAGVRKLLTTVPARRPGQQDFVRCHPGLNYRENFAVIDLKEEREDFLVVPALVPELAGEVIYKTIYTAINRQGVVFLWGVRLPTPDDRKSDWHRSAREAAELAMVRWVRVKPNMSLGAYEITTSDTVIAEPEWPELSFQELLRIAYRDRIVTSIDHAVIKRLRGQ
jgi:hypothetical protein